MSRDGGEVFKSEKQTVLFASNFYL
jgi:hypothetical protein